MNAHGRNNGERLFGLVMLELWRREWRGATHRVHACAPGMARYFVGESPMARFAEPKATRRARAFPLPHPVCQAARR